jgi:hypothetical protein
VNNFVSRAVEAELYCGFNSCGDTGREMATGIATGPGPIAALDSILALQDMGDASDGHRIDNGAGVQCSLGTKMENRVQPRAHRRRFHSAESELLQSSRD